MSAHPTLSEPARALYFKEAYPVDLLFCLVTKLGRRRAESHIQRWVPPAPADEKKKEETKRGFWTIVHHHFDADEGQRIFESARALRAHCINTPGLLSLHMHNTVAKSVVKPAHHFQYTFEQREFMLDLDLRDHDTKFPGARAWLCDCGDKDVCSMCWLMVSMGAAALDVLFSGDLGPMMPVFSGGKGCHFWWGSPMARALAEPARILFLQDLHVSAEETHFSSEVSRAIDAMADVWVRRGIVKRALLQDPEHSRLAAVLLKTYAPPGFQWPRLSPALSAPARSQAHWRAFKEAAGEARCARFIFYLGWPVPEDKVTAGTRMHMIKTPFSIHDSSARVSLPLAQVDACVPEQMPRADAQGLTQHPMWTAGVETLRQWLQVCHYPL